MPSSPSLPGLKLVYGTPRPLWSLTTAGCPRGVALAREKGWALAWDDHDWLYLLNHRGERQAQFHCTSPPAAACCADDGSAYAAAGSRGEVWWFTPDLMPRWERSVGHAAVAAALDPFGQYLAVSDARGNLRVFDVYGRAMAHTQTPRPLHYLAFVPEAPVLLGSADLGLVAGFDLTGHCLWRDGLVATVGSLAVSGSGDRVVLACYSEGLRLYNFTGQKQGHVALPEPCRLALLTFDGRLTLVVGPGNRVLLIDRKGQTVVTPAVEQPVVAAALGALGDTLVLAQTDNRVVGLDLKGGAPG
jgi:hypothetical protein